MQLGEDVGAVDLGGLGGPLDQAAHMVLGGKRDRDQRGARRDLAFAHPIERGLDVVGEGGDLLEPEHRARALDRVKRAEGAVDQIAIGGRMLEIEQRGLELLEKLLRLLPEDVGWIGGGHAPSTFLTTATSCSCWKGLVIHPVAPAAFASRLMASSDSVVRKMIGTPL